MRDPLRFATILALATAVLSGVSVFLNKYAVSAINDPVILATTKNGIVALALLLLFFLIKKNSEILHLSLRQWGMLLLIGAIGGSLPFVLFFWGLGQTDAMNAAFIHKTLFLWVLLFGFYFLRERMNSWQLLGIASLFVANIVMIGGFSKFHLSLGELAILGATILWAVENIIAKIVLRDISSTTTALARMFFGTLALLPFFLFSHGASTLTHLTLVQWGWIVLVSILLLGYVLTWYTALKYAPASYVAALLVPSLFVTNFLSAIFITQTITTTLAWGVLLFGFGTILVIAFSRTLPKSTLQKSPNMPALS